MSVKAKFTAFKDPPHAHPLNLEIYVKAKLEFASVHHDRFDRLLIYELFIEKIIDAKIYTRVFGDFIIHPDIGQCVRIRA